VQVELFLHLDHLGIGGVAQRDPDETTGLAEIVADVLDGDVGKFFTFLVGDAVDQHGTRGWWRKRGVYTIRPPVQVDGGPSFE
jgi:hypothetical protein